MKCAGRPTEIAFLINFSAPQTARIDDSSRHSNRNSTYAHHRLAGAPRLRHRGREGGVRRRVRQERPGAALHEHRARARAALRAAPQATAAGGRGGAAARVPARVDQRQGVDPRHRRPPQRRVHRRRGRRRRRRRRGGAHAQRRGAPAARPPVLRGERRPHARRGLRVDAAVGRLLHSGESGGRPPRAHRLRSLRVRRRRRAILRRA